MAVRCPLATPLCSIDLRGYKLSFNNVATIVKSENDSVPVGVWRITEECEKALDRYEGFPNLYRKEYLDLTRLGLNQGMVYIMNYDGKAVPNKNYFDTIKEGYKHFQLNTEQLVNAVLEAYDYEKDTGKVIQTRRGGSKWR